MLVGGLLLSVLSHATGFSEENIKTQCAFLSKNGKLIKKTACYYDSHGGSNAHLGYTVREFQAIVGYGKITTEWLVEDDGQGERESYLINDKSALQRYRDIKTFKILGIGVNEYGRNVPINANGQKIHSVYHCYVPRQNASYEFCFVE